MDWRFKSAWNFRKKTEESIRKKKKENIEKFGNKWNFSAMEKFRLAEILNEILLMRKMFTQ